VSTTGEKTEIGLTASPIELCAACHDAGKEPEKHAPYAQGHCILCHDPHTSEFVALTRAPTNTLCLACHGGRPANGATVSLFEEQKISPDEFNRFPKILLDRNEHFGHPFLEHPVTGGPDPFREGRSFSCLSCHLPHGAPQPKLLLPAWQKLEVCDNCHEAAKQAAKAAKTERSKP
jgi:predicted CXXCH cytochrome family protein